MSTSELLLTIVLSFAAGALCTLYAHDLEDARRICFPTHYEQEK